MSGIRVVPFRVSPKRCDRFCVFTFGRMVIRGDPAVNVTVSFLGPLREHVGEKSLVVELPAGATYRNMLDTIGPVMDARLPDWAWEKGTRSFSSRIVVTRNMTADLKDEDFRLGDGDEILVLSPLAGG